jgi:hypothetical protein
LGATTLGFGEGGLRFPVISAKRFAVRRAPWEIANHFLRRFLATVGKDGVEATPNIRIHTLSP